MNLQQKYLLSHFSEKTNHFDFDPNSIKNKLMVIKF